jgi:EAL domain-containing protein (putative c-di-GMP-specific phosphodiesterase class I)
MQALTDLTLIVDRDAATLAVLRAITGQLGCDRIEADSIAKLHELLAVRRPTIAVLAIDQSEVDALAILQLLAQQEVRPAILLLGSVNPRVSASASRAAKAVGLTVIGVATRPVDEAQVENLLSAYLSAPRAIPREELEKALAEHELFLEYEPRIALSSQSLRVRGVEALVRWQHRRRGRLMPHQFLYAIEDHGLMGALTDFVMVEAVRQAAQWRLRGLVLEMTVTLSPKLVRDRAFPERLATLLREHEMPAQLLLLDLTETPAPQDRSLMLDVVTRLRMMGIGLSLDNFGTGVSSLTELYRTPYSEIKVDRSLLADVPHERDAQLIVRAIAELAHTLELSVCAVGVETRDMLEFVQAARFDTAQGHLFGGSMNAADIEQFVLDWPKSAPAVTGSWRTLRIVRQEDNFVRNRRTAEPVPDESAL